MPPIQAGALHAGPTAHTPQPALQANEGGDGRVRNNVVDGGSPPAMAGGFGMHDREPPHELQKPAVAPSQRGTIPIPDHQPRAREFADVCSQFLEHIPAGILWSAGDGRTTAEGLPGPACRGARVAAPHSCRVRYRVGQHPGAPGSRAAGCDRRRSRAAHHSGAFRQRPAGPTN